MIASTIRKSMDLTRFALLTVHDGERQLCQPCLRIALFGTSMSAAPGLTAPFDAFLSRFGESLGWYRDGFHQAKPKRWPLADVETRVQKIRDEITRPKGAVAEFLARSPKGEWRAPGFQYWKTGGVSAPLAILSLPLDWLDEVGSGGVDSLLREIVMGGFPIASGYAGLSLFWNESYPPDGLNLSEFFRSTLMACPGMMHPVPGGQRQSARTGLVDVGWYTLLGPDLADKVGGVEGVSARLSSASSAASMSEIAVEGLPGGTLMIRAGEAPVLGDPELQESVPLQCAVGAALSALCDLEQNGLQYVPGFAPDGEAAERRTWTNRFFDWRSAAASCTP
jgi:hypothetical protein